VTVNDEADEEGSQNQRPIFKRLIQRSQISEGDAGQLTFLSDSARRRDLKAQEKVDSQVEVIGRKGDRYWTDEEHQRFIEAVKLHGKDWAKITQYVGTRSR